MSRQGGSVSVLMAASVLVVLVLVLGVADLGRVLVARSRARTAADAAALAAVQEMAIPTGEDPATFAAAFAVANGATLVSCACATGTFEAAVEVTVPIGDLRLVPGSPLATAQARAVVDLPIGSAITPVPGRADPAPVGSGSRAGSGPPGTRSPPTRPSIAGRTRSACRPGSPHSS